VRISEFHITRYGPVHYDKPFSVSGFTLFWGKNERGKTLTIDALVKLLLGKEARRFDNIGRVDEPPSGHAVVTVGGKNVKLTGKESLTDVCDLTEAECRNVFIVRASDLSIGAEEKTGEAEFYTGVSDRLTGMETKRIDRIQEALLNRARLTPTGEFSDIKDEKLKSRLTSAAALMEEITPLLEEARRTGYDELELRQVEAADQIDLIGRRMTELEDARRGSKYEKGRDALIKLADARKLLKELERYRDEDAQVWRDMLREISAQKEETKRIDETLARLREELLKAETALGKKEREFKIIDGRKKTLDEQIRPDLKNFDARSGRVGRKRGTKWLLTLAFIVLGLTACASLFGAVLYPHALFFGALILLGAGAVASFVLLVILSRQEALLSGSLERIKLTLARLDLDGDTIVEIKKRIQRFDEVYQLHRDELEEIRRRKGIVEGRISENEEKAPQYGRKIRAAEDAIVRIQRISGCETIDEFEDKISLKQHTRDIAREQIKVLEGAFEKTDGGLDDQIPSWERQVQALSVYGQAQRPVEFSEDAYREKQEELKAATDRLDGIKQSLSDFKKLLHRVQEKANEILQDDVKRIYCESSVDLEAVTERLASFRAEHEADRNAALRAVNVFEEIQEEEKGRVSLLFDEGGVVSSLFSTITGGLYDAVSFDPAAGTVSVRNRDGEILPADKLSSGAYDQLYLSIRLALGRRIAPDGAGFFIMDDPFIRSDPDRLAVQMKMLGDIAAEGWQIVYFSSKGEVKDALAKEIKKGAVTLIDI
jgi:exonuclease SbcC